MRAVVDTNILVSGLLRAGSPPAVVLESVATRRLTPVVCHEVIAEYRAVLIRPKLKLNPVDVRALITQIEQIAEWVDVPAYLGDPPLPDVDDWPFIACALSIGCSVVTGNSRHFPARLGVRVMSAREWVNEVRSESPMP